MWVPATIESPVRPIGRSMSLEGSKTRTVSSRHVPDLASQALREFVPVLAGWVAAVIMHSPAVWFLSCFVLYLYYLRHAWHLWHSAVGPMPGFLFAFRRLGTRRVRRPEEPGPMPWRTRIEVALAPLVLSGAIALVTWSAEISGQVDRYTEQPESRVSLRLSCAIAVSVYFWWTTSRRHAALHR